MSRQALVALRSATACSLRAVPRLVKSSARQRLAGARFAGALLTLLAAPAADAWVVDTQSTVNIGGSGAYASPFEILSVPVIHAAPAISVDLGLVSGGAGGHADIDARFVVDGNSMFSLASQANARSFMFTAAAQPTVGESFFLINQIDSSGIQKLNIKSDGFQAFAGLLTDIGASAWGKACAGFCVNANLGLNIKGLLSLAEIGASGLKVFGEKVDGSAPYTFSGFGGLASASANIPTFAKSFFNLQPGQAAVMAPKSEWALYANLDLAGLVAKAAGFPIPLQGDLLGFGYELIALDMFAGMDIEHAFSLQPLGLKTVYDFSSPVEFFDTGSNGWSSPVTTLTMGDNETLQLRSSAATSIGISRSYRLDYQIDYDYNLLLNAGVDLSALELHGLGLSLGPLLDPAPWKIPLGSFDIDSGSSIGTLSSNGGISNISFNPQKLITDPNGFDQLVDICTLLPGGCDRTGYVTDRVDMGGYIQETTYRVLNFGSPGCDGQLLFDCVVDPDFPALVDQVRALPDAVPGRDDELLALLSGLGLRDPPDLTGSGGAMEYAGDFQQLGEFLAAAPLSEAPASSPALLRAALQDIGIDPDNPFPPREPLTGAPPLAEGDLTEERSASLQLSVAEPRAAQLLALAVLAAAIRLRRSGRRAARAR
ncbi:MAG: hypothetical protein KDI74_15790 [Gammaproteobacteria bacterium]|nr:hypothetical protein [Gammaproteobacteria bacterium]